MYEPRREEVLVDRMPSPAVRDAHGERPTRLWADLVDDEHERGLPRSREPQPGFVWAVYRWARQERLDRVLGAAAERGAELSAGDFIRWCKQVLDLLEQLVTAPDPRGGESRIAPVARAAAAALRHGVVAQSMQP